MARAAKFEIGMLTCQVPMQIEHSAINPRRELDEIPKLLCAFAIGIYFCRQGRRWRQPLEVLS